MNSMPRHKEHILSGSVFSLLSCLPWCICSRLSRDSFCCNPSSKNMYPKKHNSNSSLTFFYCWRDASESPKLLVGLLRFLKREKNITISLRGVKIIAGCFFEGLNILFSHFPQTSSFSTSHCSTPPPPL